MSTQTNDKPVVIFEYTRAQAIADRELIDATELALQAGIKFPVALSIAAWNSYVVVPEGVQLQYEVGRLWDIVWMLRAAIARPRPSGQDREIMFQLHVRNDNRDRIPPLVTLKAVCGPDDDMKPCITIMLPDED